jgi:hypothetical protein
MHGMWPQIHDGSDKYLRHFLLWSVFLPLGSHYSIDSAFSWIRAKKQVSTDRSCRVLSGATVGISLQLVAVYVCTVLQRTGPEWCVEDPVKAFLYVKL